MWYATQEVKLAFDKSQDLLRWSEEPDVAESPKIANHTTAEMTKKAGVWDQNRDEQIGDQGRSPGGDIVGSNGKVRVCAIRLDSFDGQKEEDPNAVESS